MQVQLFVQKKNIKDSIEATGKLSKQLSSLIRENMDPQLCRICITKK